MTNRFYSPDQQFADQTGKPYANGSLYFYSSGTSAPLATFSDEALTIANANPIVLDAAGSAGSIFLQDRAYKVALVDANGLQIWTEDPVYSSDYSTLAQVQSTNGDPDGQLAGMQASTTMPASMDWDCLNNLLYVCTESGTAATARWTPINPPVAQTNVVTTPQGRLTPVSQTPFISTDVFSAVGIFYTPYVGSIVPIYNGTSFVPTEFTELTLNLTSSHQANTIYDVFVINYKDIPTLVTGPAWASSAAGTSSRGSGNGTTQVARLSGVYVNAAGFSGLNGTTDYSVSPNEGTYVGSIFIDASPGEVSCNFAYGQSRKWGVWNAYYRGEVSLLVGDPSVDWEYTTGIALQPAHNNTANSLTVFSGLQEEPATITFTQRFTAQSQLAGSESQQRSGIGVNTTAEYSGNINSYDAILQQNGSLEVTSQAIYPLAPFIGINTIYAVEDVLVSDGDIAVFFYGTQADMLLRATWRA
ncbi:hypothetical protein [Bradyrhizobium sp. dw_78]|uniref:hypothetical protein n=1 Tax=Bradyrhizobium sp. dw_78 TaxID=2719793 RepID=UPI001BD68528|nr:hypothetical protein [Bradyrhizobium sp. dw_78]